MTVTLDEIVRSLLSQEGKNTTHDYLRYLNIAQKGLKELTFDILGTSKIDLLEVNSALRVDLPSDFIDYTFVGLVGDDGRLVPLGFRDNIPRVGTGNTLQPVSDETLYDDENIIGMGGIFGHGGGQNSYGYYAPQIDTANDQMVFTSIAAGKYIYLEYIGDGSVTTGHSVIHPYAEEALTAYIYWKSIQRRRMAQSEKQAARQDYYNEKRLARARLKAFTKEEALNVIRKGFKQAPKV
jgi:hypothetical protein